MPSKKPASNSKVRAPKVVGDIPTTPPELEEDLAAETPTAPPELEAEIPEDLPPAAPAEPSSPKVPLDKEKLLTFIEDIIDTLTFKRVALIALLTAIGLTLFSLYENRARIFGTITRPAVGTSIDEPVPANWVLSNESKAGLEGLAKNTSVGMILVADVDLKKNRRTTRFFFLEDKTIVLEPAGQQALALPLPVFDYDAKNTEQMVSILSNEFRCDPYRNTVYYRHSPELADKFPTICRLAVPPFVGQFVGFLAVGITGEVSQTELGQIRLEVSRLAVEIYLNDVMKKPAPK